MCRLSRWLFSCLLIVMVGGSYAEAVNEASLQIPWGYKGNSGPEFWGRLNRQFAVCGEGKLQSPINIVKSKAEAETVLNIDYHAEPMAVMDDGATPLTIGKMRTLVNMGHTVQLNFHGQTELLHYAGDTYHLVQFHFHSPSENQLRGRAYPIEVHFVHQNAAGKVLVVGVLLRAGKQNPLLQKIIDHFPDSDGEEHLVKNEKANPAALLPARLDYYSYLGSLTTPPCTEGVQWVVMQDTLTASPAQIVQLRRAIGGSNARSVQPLHHRIITYSAETKS